MYFIVYNRTEEINLEKKGSAIVCSKLHFKVNLLTFYIGLFIEIFTQHHFNLAKPKTEVIMQHIIYLSINYYLCTSV